MNPYKRRYLYRKILFGVVFLSLSAGAQEPKRIPINIAYSGSQITEVDHRDADAALKVWAREVGEAHGFQVKTMLYESVEQMIKDFTDRKLDYVIINSIDYLKYQPVLKVRAELARSRNNRISVKYLLLVNAESNIKELADLKNKNLALRKANSLGMLFMSVELMKAKMPKADRFFAAIQEKSKESQAALAVFFGQADACLITDAGFTIMSELNPQMRRKLKILGTSPDVVEVVGFFSKEYPPQYKEAAIQGLVKGIRTSKRAKQVKLLFNTDSMDVIADSRLDSVRSLLAEYNRLEGKK